ncbi:MAG TPA: PfkB family carbohydrate kinase [Gaiellaceae bacterium]
MTRVAVVGHVEWVEFARVDHVPRPGEIVHALETWQEPAGGGAVAAVQLARLAGECLFLTALGDDELGHRAVTGLEELGLRVEAAWRPEPQRRAFVHVDRAGERTITVIGERMGPHGDDSLPWDELAEMGAVYFTAGDAAALRAARAAPRLVATTRANEVLVPAGVQLDVLVRSARDPGEGYVELDPPPSYVAETDGSGGGVLKGADGTATPWTAAPLPGPVSDAYGAGDSFAAGLTYGMAKGLAPEEAVELGARLGAAVMTGRGPYSARLATPS